MPCSWGVKAGMVRMWVAGKAVWSLCYTQAIYLSALEIRLGIIKRYTNSRFLLLLYSCVVSHFQLCVIRGCAIVCDMRTLIILCMSVYHSVCWCWWRCWWHSTWSVVSLLLSKCSRPSHRKGTAWVTTWHLTSHVDFMCVMSTFKSVSVSDILPYEEWKAELDVCC